MKYLLIILIFTLFSCKEQAKIPISNTLEIALNNKYSNYVNILNNTLDGDSLALKKFLK